MRKEDRDEKRNKSKVAADFLFIKYGDRRMEGADET